MGNTLSGGYTLYLPRVAAIVAADKTAEVGRGFTFYVMNQDMNTQNSIIIDDDDSAGYTYYGNFNIASGSGTRKIYVRYTNVTPGQEAISLYAL